MPAVSGDFGKFVLPAIQKYIDTNMPKSAVLSEGARVFKTGKIDREYVEVKQTEATGPMQVIEQGGRMAELTVPEGYPKRIGVREAGIKGVWTKRKIRLGGKEYVRRVKEGIMNAPKQYFNTLGMLYLEYADTALASVPKAKGVAVIDSIGGDGLTLAHAAHTFNSDGAVTNSNKTSTYKSLTQDGLQSDINTVMQWKNNENVAMGIRVKSLWVGQTNAAKAFELLHSAGKSETANRSDNALKEYLPPRPVVLQSMINQNEYILETTAENDYCLLTAWDEESETEYDKETRTWYLYLDGAHAHGCGFPLRYFFNKQ